MPAKSCPLVRATTAVMRYDDRIRQANVVSFVVPTTCDQKKKLASFTGEMAAKMYLLEMPASKESDAARFYWQESVKGNTYPWLWRACPGNP